MGQPILQLDAGSRSRAQRHVRAHESEQKEKRKECLLGRGEFDFSGSWWAACVSGPRMLGGIWGQHRSVLRHGRFTPRNGHRGDRRHTGFVCQKLPCHADRPVTSVATPAQILAPPTMG